VIETTVLVDDGQIIVLGGLIDEDTQETMSSVPILGSIPLIGRLFQSSSSTTVKKNLMVFLRPTIIVDSAVSSEISAEKYNYIKVRQALSGQETKLIDLTEPKD
jgi:general secretion pathway protein D